MTEACIGAYSTKDDAGDSHNFAGSADKMYELSGSDWTQIDTGFTTGTEGFWRFERFGNLVIATNYDNPVQKYDLSSDTSFAALAGSPPQAQHIAVVRNFVVLGHLNSGGANKVRWCANDDATEWTIGTDEAGEQTIPEGGPITGLMGGEFGLVFQENRITRMDYQGPPLNFSFDEIEKNNGCIASGSVIRFGILTYYLSQNGFYVTDGTKSVPIGNEKVDKYFFSKLDQELLYKITSTIDPINKVVIWSYASNQGSGEPDWLIMYNWDTQRWSEIEVDHQVVFNTLSTGRTLESLDTDYPDIDAMTISFDSRVFQGGTLLLAAINSSNALATFTGDVMEACLRTGIYELNEFEYTFISEVWPEIDGTVSVKVGSQTTHQSSLVQSGAINVNTYGFAPFTENSRYHDFEFCATDFTKASGFKVKAVSTGEY